MSLKHPGLKVLQDEDFRRAGSSEEAEPPQRRGVANPRIVDLIVPDPERGEVVLKMLEPRPWGANQSQLQQLEDKINSYLGYVLDGFLVEQYPRYRGVPVRVQLECVEEPSGVAAEMLEAAARFCGKEGLAFAVRVVEDPAEWRVPWEESAERTTERTEEERRGDRGARQARAGGERTVADGGETPGEETARVGQGEGGTVQGAGQGSGASRCGPKEEARDREAEPEGGSG